MKSDKTLSGIHDLLFYQLGGNGTEVLSGTGAHTNKNYYCIQINEAATFSVLQDSDDVDMTVGSGTIAAGTILKAVDKKTIKDITLLTGSIIGVIK